MDRVSPISQKWSVPCHHLRASSLRSGKSSKIAPHRQRIDSLPIAARSAAVRFASGRASGLASGERLTNWVNVCSGDHGDVKDAALIDAASRRIAPQHQMLLRMHYIWHANGHLFAAASTSAIGHGMSLRMSLNRQRPKWPTRWRVPGGVIESAESHELGRRFMCSWPLRTRSDGELASACGQIVSQMSIRSRAVKKSRCSVTTRRRQRMRRMQWNCHALNGSMSCWLI